MEASEPQVSTRGFLLSVAKKALLGEGREEKKTWRLSVGATTLVRAIGEEHT